MNSAPIEAFMKLQLVCAAIVVQSACTLPITNWSYSVSSPDDRARATVRTRGLKPHRVELRIESPDSVRTVFTRDYSDVYVHFCELHWTPDSRVIEMFLIVNEGYQVVVAYDLVSKEPVTSAWATEDLRHAIAANYALSPSDDSFKFAETSQAQVLFNERYESTARRERGTR
jgi:hypothetical protein